MSRGRHRKPTHTGRNLAAISASGAFAIPALVTGAGTAEAQAGFDRDAIIACESGGDARAQNASSTASGLYQFINATWKAYGGSTARAKDASVTEQHRVAARAFAAEGYSPWNASKDCWSGKIGSGSSVTITGGAQAPARSAAQPRREARSAAPQTQAAPTRKAKTAPQGKTARATGARAEDGSGSYVCDPARLHFDACDPGTIGQAVAYPLYDGRHRAAPAQTVARPAAATPAAATSRAPLIAAAAKGYLGVPYVWGGHSRAGMDCSGLVWAVLRDLGYSPPRTALAQSKWATPVSASEARPGDLVFHYSPVSHVGIYLGGGRMVDASQPGTSVSVHNVYPGVTRYGRVPS